ncbi:MAG TPA: 23S rRNA (guanosine(2251)-2'-O)-methyltransferase RlmB [bacterium]|nr:23S rRNA (guanosine(2251)-2'-O)-methyltransferase RlmB [bacterium]
MADMILYGRNVIRELLKISPERVHELIILKNSGDLRQIAEEAAQKNVKITFTDRAGVFRLTGTEKNQGVAARVEPIKVMDIKEFLAKHKDDSRVTVAVLDEIEDPHNVGAIIRSCEVFGICGIILSSNRSAPVNETVYKVSSGAAAYVDIVMVSNINIALEKLKEAGFWVYGLDADAEKRVGEVEFDRKTALVLGNEGRGLRPLVRKNSDFLVKIEQKGKIDSLNVSNAAAIVFYELMKSAGSVSET